MIHDGKVLQQAPVEDLLSGHYLIAGPKEEMQAYLADKRVVSTHAFGRTLSATVEGEPGAHSELLTVSRPELQDLFIELTNEKERSPS